ncbi:MAG: cryptochrome/photolyase family protein [Flavobacterium sp.]
MKKLRLILGDQLNIHHSWYQEVKENTLYLLAEMPQELGYVKHHIQKIATFFLAMRDFGHQLQAKGHQVHYIKISENNWKDLPSILHHFIEVHAIEKFEYQLPDEYRLEEQLKKFCHQILIPNEAFDTEHFYTHRDELTTFFAGKKQLLMESFYRYMRKKHQVLMIGDQPLGGKWNFDHDNRKTWKESFPVPKEIAFHNDATAIQNDLQMVSYESFGEIDWQNISWPINEQQALATLHYFIQNLLPYFGDYQDAMHTKEKYLFHSRLSFALNAKIISPKKVVDMVVEAYHHNPDIIALSQVEGFVRQIIGWREYVRGIYWKEMPAYGQKNELQNYNRLPNYFWTGETNMQCLKKAIGQSLTDSYAHHIQRLMVIGNFSLLTQIHPDEVDAWYLGVYIDAIEWVEMPNTRGMSQYADGGILATKPYVSSGSYINKMSNYCGSCAYKVKEKTSENACPFNSLYWHFLQEKQPYLQNNQRIQMMYALLNKMPESEKEAIQKRALYLLENLNDL